MTREEIISDLEFLEDAIYFDAVELDGRKVNVHELFYYIIEELRKEQK